jgi:hypothetical protein
MTIKNYMMMNDIFYDDDDDDDDLLTMTPHHHRWQFQICVVLCVMVMPKFLISAGDSSCSHAQQGDSAGGTKTPLLTASCSRAPIKRKAKKSKKLFAFPLRSSRILRSNNTLYKYNNNSVYCRIYYCYHLIRQKGRPQESTLLHTERFIALKSTIKN